MVKLGKSCIVGKTGGTCKPKITGKMGKAGTMGTMSTMDL